MYKHLTPLLGAVLLLSQACAAQPGELTEGVGPEEVGSETTAIRIAPAESSDYYSLRRDFRRCAWPFCGGYWVSSLNLEQTTCPDGTVADECYVTGFDLSVLGLNERDEADFLSDLDGVLLHGGFGEQNIEGRSVWFFEADEAWRPLTDAEPRDWFFKAADNGVRCVTTPCDTLEAAYLNYPWWFGLDRLDLRRLGLTEAQADEATAALYDGGLLLSGYAFARYRRHDIRLALHATQAYLQVRPSAPAPEGPFCGGIAGIRCPGHGECVDNPSDGCDPASGGADCGGICECRYLTLCGPGQTFDDSPEVCACVSDTISTCAATLCPVGTNCIEHEGSAVCVSDGTLACGSATCGEGLTCCNASCGMCTPPGTACIQIACGPDA